MVLETPSLGRIRRPRPSSACTAWPSTAGSLRSWPGAWRLPGTRSSRSTCVVTATRAASRPGIPAPTSPTCWRRSRRLGSARQLGRPQLRRPLVAEPWQRATRSAPGAWCCSTQHSKCLPSAALRGAEIERLDWSFATVEVPSTRCSPAEQVVAAPRATVVALRRGGPAQGARRPLRFSFCPSAAVVAWSEMALPAPPIAELPTLALGPAVSLFGGEAQDDSLPRGAGRSARRGDRAQRPQRPLGVSGRDDRGGREVLSSTWASVLRAGLAFVRPSDPGRRLRRSRSRGRRRAGRQPGPP